MNKNYYCVIMAGGIGSRFWPLSRTTKPKQFLDILGTGRTFLQMTYDRLARVCPKENILIVTNRDYKQLTLDQLPDIKESQVLLEPFRRNTAPCIAYASYKIKKQNPEAVVVVAPSDHLIINEDSFVEYLFNGLSFAEKNDALLTLGIEPNRPDTGYGYIQVNSEVRFEGHDKLRKVKTFTEKPNLEMAEFFLKSGEFMWNSGIFIWSLKSILSAFQKNLPDVDSLFAGIYQHINTGEEEAQIARSYAACTNVSIDYGVMEKAKNVYTLCSDFGWSDLGTWGSLFENSKKTNENNVLQGDNIMTYDSSGNIINVGQDKLVVIEGLNDYIVVESNNTLLICKRQDEQEIRQIVNDVKLKKGDNFV